MKLAIIGSGNVGRATGIGFYLRGNDVIFCDVEEEKLLALRKEGHKVTNDLFDAVDKSDVSFVCVPTPTTDGKTDTKYVDDAVIDIAQALRNHKKYHLVVIRSTVLPSTARCQVIPKLEQISHAKAGIDFGVCSNPEFLRKATALEDFLKPSRIVIGQFDKKSGDILQGLYSTFPAPIIRTDLDSAEMIKYISNAFLSTKISFFNEIHMICEDLGLDPELILKAVAMDARIGTYGTVGGRPFEGECLPKDIEAFISYIETKGHNPKILKAAQYINQEMHRRCNSGKRTQEIPQSSPQ
jgi:UDPglucose 6-dehydrogenase